jgi:hypothetical protein
LPVKTLFVHYTESGLLVAQYAFRREEIIPDKPTTTIYHCPDGLFLPGVEGTLRVPFLSTALLQLASRVAESLQSIEIIP